jgi:hypothetical protein
MNTYIHSYQYVPNNILKHIDLFYDTSTYEHYIINKKTTEKLIGLKNIPINYKDFGIYKVFLSKLLNKKKSCRKNNIINTCNQINICIYVEIDFDRLLAFINTFKRIPSSESFFLLLKRNFLSEVNQEYSVNLDNKNKFKINNNIYFNIDPNIFIYKNVFFDYINSRYFLNLQEYDLFQRSNKIPNKSNYLFFINDFDINGKPEIVKNLKGKTLIISSDKNIDTWKKGSYSVIDKIPFNKNLLNYDKIIVQSNVFFSSKYKNFFRSSIGLGSTDVYLNESIYTDYLLELISYNRDPDNYESNILIHLINWENIILDVDLSFLKKNKFLNEMIKLLTCDLFIYYYENKKTQISYDDIRKILNQILNINIPFLNNYLLNKYQTHIFYNKSNKKYNQNFDIKTKKLVLGQKQIKFLNSLDLNKQLKYVCFPNIIKGERYKLINKNTKSSCTICLDEISIKNLGITSCNHTFCYSCIKRNLQNSFHCPNCRKKLTSNDVFKGIDFSSFTYLNENNKVRDILNKTYDLILTKYPENKQIISTFLNDHGILATTIGNENNDNFDILIDDYENIENLKNIKEILIMESLYSDDRYYKYKLNCLFKTSKANITQYNYNLNLSC